MAKSRRDHSQQDRLRQSRREVLLARRRDRQTRQLRLLVVGVISLIILVVGVGFVMVYLVTPAQAVAIVNGEEIAMREWQDRVRFQRTQLVIGIDQLAEAVGGDIGQVQQLAGQQINLLMDPPTLGQTVLEEVINDRLIRQEAARRGITVSDEELQLEIEESFNFFGGAAPTPSPTPTETIMPTPSLTPIPTAVITDVVPTSTPFPTPTTGPTSTPLPTSTPVSQEAFQQDYQDLLDQFARYDVTEAQFREIIRSQLYEERLRDALAEEEGLPAEEEQVSFWYLAYDSEEQAEAAREQVVQEDFLTVWNTVRSQPAAADGEPTGFASEFLWRSRESVATSLNEDVAEEAFALPPSVPSRVISVPGETEEEADRFYLIMVSGREVRPLSEAAINNRNEQILQTWLEAQRASGVETLERWRANVPSRPILDARYLVAPTPAPTVPVTTTPTATPGAGPTPAG
jgi:hypothetical protein